MSGGDECQGMSIGGEACQGPRLDGYRWLPTGKRKRQQIPGRHPGAHTGLTACESTGT